MLAVILTPLDTCNYARMWLEGYSWLRPATSGDVDEIYRLGVSHPFRAPAEDVPGGGCPNNPDEPLNIPTAVWKAIRVVTALLLGTSQIPPPDAHTVLKRIPGRSWPD